MGEIWRTTLTDSFNKFLGKAFTFLPNLLAMITILIIGFLIAWLFKVILLRLLKAIHLDRISNRWGLVHELSKVGVTYSPVDLFCRFCYWVIVLVSILLGINALEVAATQNLITQFLNYLPHLFAAILIISFHIKISGYRLSLSF